MRYHFCLLNLVLIQKFILPQTEMDCTPSSISNVEDIPSDKCSNLQKKSEIKNKNAHPTRHKTC